MVCLAPCIHPHSQSPEGAGRILGLPTGVLAHHSQLPMMYCNLGWLGPCPWEFSFPGPRSLLGYGRKALHQEVGLLCFLSPPVGPPMALTGSHRMLVGVGLSSLVKGPGIQPRAGWC